MPATSQFLDSLGDMAGFTAIDIACGGGDVTFEIARRVGAAGRVLGLDFDEAQLAIVRAEALERNVTNASFQAADIRSPLPVESADLAYARFILTHLRDPQITVDHAFRALRPGGVFAVEDIDWGGHFCHPPSAAFDRYYASYLLAANARGGDAFIGLKLERLLHDAGFTRIEVRLVQAFGRTGDIKLIPALTLMAMRDGLVDAELAEASDLDAAIAELEALSHDDETVVFMPRMLQVSGVRP
jgi:ubiquinone/menaquinone biosynthesis C-methylase UbiE